MSELVVFIFRDPYRAPEVLNDLRRRELPWRSDLDEAVAVSLDGKGRTRVHLCVDLSKTETVSWARMWGSLLSTTMFLPLTDAMVEAADGVASFSGSHSPLPTEKGFAFPEASWWRECFHLSDDFKRDVAAVMLPGGSAVLMLLRTARVPVALEQLRDYGDTIVHTTLDNDQDDKMLAMLAHGGVNHEYRTNGNPVVDSSARAI